MTDYDFRCTDCGAVRPVGIHTDDESEVPDELKDICGTRWGGCGDVKVLERAND